MRKLRLIVVKHFRLREEAIQKWQGWKLKPKLFLLLGEGMGQNPWTQTFSFLSSPEYFTHQK